MPQAETDLTCSRFAAAYPWDESTGLIRGEMLGYDDVRIVPGYSRIPSRKDVDTTAQLTPTIRLKVPIISSNMDSVTEATMAIFMANNGGIGAMHRNMTLRRNEEEAVKVKKSREYEIVDFPRVNSTDNVQTAETEMRRHSRGFGVVYDVNNPEQWVGIYTTRDIKAADSALEGIVTVMTSRPEVLVGQIGMSRDDARRFMRRKKVEKVFLLDDAGNIARVVADRDLRDDDLYPYATKDQRGRLQVIGSVGIRDEGLELERAQMLRDAGVDAILVDTAHADHAKMEHILQQLAKMPGMPDRIVGNFTSPSAIARFAQQQDTFGTLVFKLHIGPGFVCKTRIVSGAGLPAWSTDMYGAAEAAKYGVKVIADGGIVYPGDVPLAIGAGADAVMIGSLFAGREESPGRVRTDDKSGKRYKVLRGMSASQARVDFQRLSGIITDEEREATKVAAEGVSVKVEFKGPAKPLMDELAGGLRSGMSYAGAENVAKFQQVVVFARQSLSGIAEGKPRALD